MENEEYIVRLMKLIRVSSESSKEEICDLVSAGIRELEIAGVYGDLNDDLFFQAIKLYCKANYGYDENTERFQKAYECLRDSMALSGDYSEKAGALDG